MDVIRERFSNALFTLSQLSRMNILFIVLVVLVMIIYIKYYVTTVNDMQILQMSVAQLTPSYLFEKRPIVITDRLVHPSSILRPFKYLYVYHATDAWYSEFMPTDLLKNLNQYLIVYCDNETGIVELQNSGETVQIPIQKHQLVIIPHLWKYRLQGAFVLLKLHTTMSLMLSPVIYS